VKAPFIVRPEVGHHDIRALLLDVAWALNARVEKYGGGAFAGHHEGLGTITEEYFELVAAVRSNDSKEVQKEAMDVIVPCLWLILSSKMKDRVSP
jgi:hypothetical protein